METRFLVSSGGQIFKNCHSSHPQLSQSLPPHENACYTHNLPAYENGTFACANKPQAQCTTSRVTIRRAAFEALDKCTHKSIPAPQPLPSYDYN